MAPQCCMSVKDTLVEGHKELTRYFPLSPWHMLSSCLINGKIGYPTMSVSFLSRAKSNLSTEQPASIWRPASAGMTPKAACAPAC